MTVKKRNICDIHDDIKHKANDILNINPDRFENTKDLYEEIESIATDIYSLSDDALVRGTAMETRLQDYRDAIEHLGFVRNR